MTSRSRPSRLTLAFAACALLASCGVTGKTSGFRLPLGLPRDWAPIADVQVASVAMAPDAASLEAVNVRPWGKFDTDDLRNLERSLRDSIAAPLSEAPAARSTLNVHLIIRRYAVSVSNTAGAVLASVAWAVTDSDGKIVNQEEFYAADAGHLVGTIGALKDAVHRSIVRRIGTTALALAAVPSSQQFDFHGTYTSFEEAASHLPATMVSMGRPGVIAFPDPIVGTAGVLTPSGVRTVRWDVAKPTDGFDWTGYLSELSASP